MSDAKTPDLFERFVTELENPDRRQCTGALRKDFGDGPAYCAEGFAADILIAAFPERFRWSEPTVAEEADYRRLVDNAHPGAKAGVEFTEPFLTQAQWALFHPRMHAIERRAGTLLGNRYGIIAANDDGLRSAPDIAAALRQARAEIDREASETGSEAQAAA